MLSYNEKSGVEVIAEFFDANGSYTLPMSVHYRVDCASTRKALLDWTQANAVTTVDLSGQPVYSATIEIPGYVNAIQSNRNRQEVKTVLIVANKDQDAEFSQEYQYTVKNLQGRS